jgi:hypothetical protein
MRSAASAALTLAGLLACAGGYTHGTTDPGDSGIPPAAVGGDGGDAGPDAGRDAGYVAVDAGADAGCTPLTFSPGNAGIVDTCISMTASVGTASVSVDPAACSVIISMTTGTGHCTGPVAGPNDAFHGDCGGNPQCSSVSLPGNIICVTGPYSSCSIKVCDGGC